MSERLSPEAERLVRAGRSGLSPSGRDIDRLRARILTSVAAGAAAGVTGASAAAASTAGGATAATGSAATAGAIGLVKVVVVVAAVTGASVTGGVLIARRGEPTPAASAPHREGSFHDSSRRAAPPSEEEAVEPEPDAGAVAPDAGTAPVVPARSRRPVADPASSLASEMDLLRRARAAQRERDPRGALEHLDRHAARFPDSSLAPEAAAIRIQATCAVGDRETAQVLADQFLRRWPDSPLARRVPRLCGEEAP